MTCKYTLIKICFILIKIFFDLALRNLKSKLDLIGVTDDLIMKTLDAVSC